MLLKLSRNTRKSLRSANIFLFLSAALSVVMVVFQSTGNKSLTFLLVTIIVTVALLFDEMKLLGGNYILAVELVNSLDVVSWAYNNGLAIIMLPGEQFVLYDTARGELYFLVKGSVQEFMTTREQKKIFKLSVIARSSLPHNFDSKAFKIEIIEGVVEAPSINNEKAVMRYTGTIIKAKLKTRCLIKLSECVKKINDFLRNTQYVKPY